MATGLTRRRALALAGALIPSAAMSASAYPEKPIRLVVALAPGGPADTAARAFGPFLAQVLGQNVLIENRPGASAIVGTESVTRASPDGYTLLFGSSSTFAVNPAVMTKLRFDTQKDLKLIRLVAQTPHVLTVRSAIAAHLLRICSMTSSSLLRRSRVSCSMRRLSDSPGERAVQARDRSQYQPCPVPRRRPGRAWRHGRRRGHLHQRCEYDAVEYPGRQPARFGDAEPEAVAAAAGSADFRRTRLSENRVVVLDRVGGAGEHTRIDHHASRQGNRPGFCVGGLPGGRQEDRIRVVRLQRRTDGSVHEDRSRKNGPQSPSRRTSASTREFSL
jgi:Tripartite tricarboxylate transporter family receptor